MFLLFVLCLFYCFVCSVSMLRVIFFCIVSPHVYSSLLSICIQVYRPLPPGGNPIAVNNYHIIYHAISYSGIALGCLSEGMVNKSGDLTRQQDHNSYYQVVTSHQLIDLLTVYRLGMSTGGGESSKSDRLARVR